eukprot:CAMPEP_0178438156 /NCGR_PEP_ID=MMETSP0689_2-20121128/35423_1 /TAXON_ID=160604 /ORGANISM="Amphidinium massartii, Strain CS-259" /LENGTH=247 /DNA_ID=CAMNT_0020060501 /DNA_START=62 /DNA_END=802 /DNA_ORIENTATION=-
MAQTTNSDWTDQHLEHLIWYLNAKPRPKGELEAKLGDSCSPMKLCPGSRKVEAAGAEKLDTLIAYVQAEVDEKDLRARASMVQHRIIALEDVCLGHGKSGQAALDDYVEELVAALRDFPYHRLRGGKEVGTWVRDEVVAAGIQGALGLLLKPQAGWLLLGWACGGFVLRERVIPTPSAAVCKASRWSVADWAAPCAAAQLLPAMELACLVDTTEEAAGTYCVIAAGPMYQPLTYTRRELMTASPVFG